MTATTTYPFAKAQKAAEYILQLLRPHCEKIHIAGSVRRMRPDVKDIEIVCIPKKEIKQSGLFPDFTEKITDRNFTEGLASITEIIILGSVEGRYMKIRTNSQLCPGIHLDLFMPQPSDYYRMYAIRTGSAEYAHHVIAAAWKRKGWVGVKDIGLRKINECNCKEDNAGKKTYSFKQEIINAELVPVWRSEAEFFAWLGINYIDPEYREYNKPVNEFL